MNLMEEIKSKSGIVKCKTDGCKKEAVIGKEFCKTCLENNKKKIK